MILEVQGRGLDACPPPPPKNPPGLHLELLDEIMEISSLHFQRMESFLLLSQLLLLGSCLHLQLCYLHLQFCCPRCVSLRCLLCPFQLRLGGGKQQPRLCRGAKTDPIWGGKK